MVCKVGEILTPLNGIQTNSGWVVGDTHPSNILINKGIVSGVLDWEGVAENKLTFYDWFQFIFSVVIEYVKANSKGLDHAEVMEHGSSLIFRSSTSRIGKILNRQTDYFLNSIGLPTEKKLNLFVLFLVDYYWIKDKGKVLENLLPGLLN